MSNPSVILLRLFYRFFDVIYAKKIKTIESEIIALNTHTKEFWHHHFENEWEQKNLKNKNEELLLFLERETQHFKEQERIFAELKQTLSESITLKQSLSDLKKEWSLAHTSKTESASLIESERMATS